MSPAATATTVDASQQFHTISTTATSTAKSKNDCLVEPKRFEFKDSLFEYSVHAPSDRFLRDMATVFPHLSVRQRKDLLVVPVIQQCENDMVGLTYEVNKERDDKLELFVDWGKRVADRLASVGFWADVTDPASGFPVLSEAGPSPYPDVQATTALTRYDIQNVGCCHILLHPAWKSRIYPATFFTIAPADILVKVIDEINSALQQ
ncbi:methylmalonic aciduria and homocystinuria type D protein [Zychaea mexicana]|uniref:methylmalonic aciduria and homocystinuria type D protein n=1 Tax=Zychaea mexicana TaxID=64656 RepID=UPI0022FF41E0|nr:methylmalonic aciduria and homocystinuria type D protein [Zychaea mexicana]KAI9499583.1 methylmalonic aciduria and homocystinuria type D protein [Zychaea mexicana]